MYSASPPVTVTQQPVHEHLFFHSNRSTSRALFPQSISAFRQSWAYPRALLQSLSAGQRSSRHRNHAAPLPCQTLSCVWCYSRAHDTQMVVHISALEPNITCNQDSNTGRQHRNSQRHQRRREEPTVTRTPEQKGQRCGFYDCHSIMSRPLKMKRNAIKKKEKNEKKRKLKIGKSEKIKERKKKEKAASKGYLPRRLKKCFFFF